MNQCNIAKNTGHLDLHLIPSVRSEGKSRTVIAEGSDAVDSSSDQHGLRQRMENSRLATPGGMFLKRVIDICIALPVVVLILPPLAILVRLGQWRQSPGPLFFRQVRCGRNRKEFTILKFRTMNLPDEEGTDPGTRIFPVGRFLRHTKLDEIPQFVNVLLGTMSIVGPRPHHFQDCKNFEQAVEDYVYRTIAKPGITGLAQYTEYRGDFEWNCIESRVQQDLIYIQKWSLWLDFGLILSTAGAIVRNSLRVLARRVVSGFAKEAPETHQGEVSKDRVIILSDTRDIHEPDSVQASRAA